MMRKTYMEPTDPKMNKYAFRDRSYLFNQVHIYVSDPLPANSYFSFHSREIDHINMYAPNKGASKGSHILGASLIILTLVGIAVGAATSIW